MAYIPSSGSVVAFQGNPSVLQAVVAVTNTPSISGTVNIGTQSGSVVAVLQGNASIIALIQGSVATVAPANQSVSGTININPASVQVLNPVSLLAVNPNPSSVFVVNPVSVLTVTQSGAWSASLVGTIPGSVISFQAGTRISSISGTIVVQSIVGTYGEDVGHTTGDAGLLTFGVRNDTMSSVTSADNDYSPVSVGPIGEVIAANAPITKWVQGQTSIMYGTSVQTIAAQGASIFTYITAIQIANVSANVSLVKFTGGLGSTLGYTIAPANGGSNMYFPNGLKTGENSGFSASISGISSVFLSVQGFISKI